MQIDTVFVTRFVRDHERAIAWYQQVFGRRWDREPQPNCREWELRPGLLFQVIHDPAQADGTTFAFAVGDLHQERARLAEAGLSPAAPVRVEGFDDLWFAPLIDPEGVETGLLNSPPAE